MRSVDSVQEVGGEWRGKTPWLTDLSHDEVTQRIPNPHGCRTIRSSAPITHPIIRPGTELAAAQIGAFSGRSAAFFGDAQPSESGTQPTVGDGRSGRESGAVADGPAALSSGRPGERARPRLLGWRSACLSNVPTPGIEATLTAALGPGRFNAASTQRDTTRPARPGRGVSSLRSRRPPMRRVGHARYDSASP